MPSFLDLSYSIVPSLSALAGDASGRPAVAIGPEAGWASDVVVSCPNSPTRGDEASLTAFTHFSLVRLAAKMTALPAKRWLRDIVRRLSDACT